MLGLRDPAAQERKRGVVAVERAGLAGRRLDAGDQREQRAAGAAQREAGRLGRGCVEDLGAAPSAIRSQASTGPPASGACAIAKRSPCVAAGSIASATSRSASAGSSATPALAEVAQAERGAREAAQLAQRAAAAAHARGAAQAAAPVQQAREAGGVAGDAEVAGAARARRGARGDASAATPGSTSIAKQPRPASSRS